MMETKDWMSLFVGSIVFALGLLPILNKFQIGPPWFELNFLSISIFSYLLAIFGFYLIINSIHEITNSNAVGWWSFLIAFIFFSLGLVQILNKFQIWVFKNEIFSLSFMQPLYYHISFVILGFFLIIAAFMMEL